MATLSAVFRDPQLRRLLASFKRPIAKKRAKPAFKTKTKQTKASHKERQR